MSDPARPARAGTRRERRERSRAQARQAYGDLIVSAVAQAALGTEGVAARDARDRLDERGGVGPHDPTVLLRLSHPQDDDEAARWAAVTIWGAGILALELSGGFTRLEFEVDEGEVDEVAPSFVALAAGHLHGRSREVTQPCPDGRQRRWLEVAVDGEVQRVPEPPEPLFGSWQEARLGLPRLLVSRVLRSRR
ncbi:hypothetical protein ACUN7V_16540 [Quadrisphaera oryzae]|uniref:hypothetical protein n=1 Tax=Quadrisphaera TaxID=317661 RepID=UPI0016440923|nr:hypothetical protein [Quadrisphaera sp. RL12-1S]MBC3760884.1 hypothetical protein [Quadrisphaera sp. RL12-1S]